MQSATPPVGERLLIPRWTIAVAFAVVAIVLIIAMGGPAALLSSHWPFYGDQPGQDWWLAGFRSQLLHGSAFGWNSQTNNGFLFGYFYFPLPPLFVTALATVVSVAAAAKVMVLLSVLSIPFGMWQLVKGLGYSRFLQTATVLSSLMVLLSNHPITIGGTLYDALLGEFSITLAIGCALCCLGAMARLRRGVGSWWPVALWGAATALAHVQGVVALALVTLAFAAWDIRDRAAVRPLLLAAIAAAGLSAWWWLPAITVQGQALGDVNPVEHNLAAFVWNGGTGTVWVLGVLGLGYATWRRFDGAKQMLSAIAVLGVALLLPLQIADTGRLLPIMFPLTGIGVALGLVALTEVLATRVTVTLATVGGLVLTAILSGGLPLLTGQNATILTSFDHQTDAGMNNLPGYTGARALATALEALPTGRVMVETPTNYQTVFGERLWTPLLSLWTNGHAATPLSLFINATPSSIALEYAYENLTSVYAPVVGWQPHPASPYPSSGINELRALGVNYYVATSPALASILNKVPGVRLVRTIVAPLPATTTASASTATQGTFWLYAISNASLVTGVPATMPMGALPTKAYALSMTSYLDTIGATTQTVSVPVVNGPTYSGPVATVSNVAASNTTISFHVATIGEPVLIRETYSPQWHVTGAAAVLRAEPNEMMVVPTSHDVTLRFANPVTVPVGAVVSLLTWGAIAAVLIRRRGSAVAEA